MKNKTNKKSERRLLSHTVCIGVCAGLCILNKMSTRDYNESNQALLYGWVATVVFILTSVFFKASLEMRDFEHLYIHDKYYSFITYEFSRGQEEELEE